MIGSISNYSAPKVSVIMPVYNTELYVERAMISLMEQTLDDVQFIIIDDGSKDNSLSIIKEIITRYPSRKDQIILISRENRGVAATRAQGMKLATGDYIIHFDSDDWTDNDWLETLYNKAVASDADVIICDFFVECLNKTLIANEHVASSSQNCVKNLLVGDISNSSCNKLVKANIFRDHEITFHSKYDMGEDFFVTFLVFMNANKIVHVNKPLYHYNRLNENSLTKSYSIKALDDLVGIVELTEFYLNKANVIDLYTNELDVFKLGVKLQFALHFHNDIERIKLAFDLYPDTNRLIFCSKFRALKLVYAMRLLHLLFLYKKAYHLWKLVRIRLRRLNNICFS
ncbi:glycosyltransferase family 2 protein [Vibrio mimicus]